jgi:RNA polymerase sigma-70 factor (ECF subfamily)
MPVLSWKGAATQGHAEIGDLALRHLDAAYNLGRWLLGNEHDAADAVHDAFLRATASAGSRADGNPRAWWLAIVRNCCLARLATHGKEHRNVALDQVAAEHGRDAADALVPPLDDPIEDHLEHGQRRALVRHHLQRLPTEFREVLVLRELEELSYREIADMLDLPIGTVMSRLARGRAALQRAINPSVNEVDDGL